MACFVPVRCQVALRGCTGWHQLHRSGDAEPQSTGRGREDRAGGEGARHLLRTGWVPHEPQCPQPRHLARCNGTSGQVPAIDDPGLGLCGQFRPPHPGATVGRHQPYFPWSVRLDVMADEPWAKNRYDLRLAQSPDAPETAEFNDPRGDFGWIHSYETGSTLDGPGIRVVVFMSGCLLRCLYCHNPDTWHLKDGTRVSLERAKTALQAYAAPLRAMDGGLTISGGEPLFALHFTKRLFA